MSEQLEAGRSTRRYELRRDRILDVATTLLNERGVDGMTFQEVAQALDLKTASVTYYFRYKEQLAAAVLEDSLARLHEIAQDALSRPTPLERVDRYMELYFRQHARALRERARPFAILSEIRTLPDPARAALIESYLASFRLVRQFFEPQFGSEAGTKASTRERQVNTARAHILNEMLFWSDIWLGQYATLDFVNVRRRMLAILTHGLTAKDASFHPAADIETTQRDGSIPAQFMRTATRMINQHGYKGASIDRITGELNITKGGFYHYVSSKDDLVLACFKDSFRRLGEIQAQASSRPGTRWEQTIQSIGAAVRLQFADEYPLLRTTALQAMPPQLRQIALEQTRRLTLWLSGVLVDGMEHGAVRILDPLLASQLIASTVNSAYDLRGWAAKQPGSTAVEIYLDILLRGLFHPMAG